MSGAPAATASKDRLRAWLKILKTARHIEKELRERFRTELDTTLPRFDVMSALDRSSAGLRMNELSSALRVSNGNVTGIVDRLVENGLVERQAVQGDRRAQHICLTARGQKTFIHHARIHESWVDELLADLPPPQAEQLVELLDMAATTDSITKDTITKDTITKDTITKDTITKDTITKDTITKDTVTTDSITKDTVTKDTITKDTA